MEKKNNKKLLIVIGILLVITLGSTFAYFISKVITSGSGSEVNATTATIKGSELNVVGTLNFNDTGVLPGHKNISSIKLTATGDNELIVYNLVWNGTNTLNTPLEFTVYKTSNNIETNTTCEKKQKVVNGSIYYNEECDITNIGELGKVISSGTINKEETKVTLVHDEFITSTTGGEVVYYYVVLEYPNLEGNQNNDIGGSFSGKVTVEESTTEPDINILVVYIKQGDGTYKEIKDVPREGYIVNEEKSTCSNGSKVSGVTPNITINSLSKSGTNCNLYLDTYTAQSYILANNTIDESRISGEFTSTFEEDTNGRIFKGPADDYGETTYIFAGANPNNWVQFAGKWWRIVRINGNGSVRLIYAGSDATKEPQLTGEDTQIGKSAFNEQVGDNAYVGYMYGTAGSDNYNGTHANTNNSTIKEVIDTWYENNIDNNVVYSSKIETNAGFCGDRTIATSSQTWWNSDTRKGYGTQATAYIGFSRHATISGSWNRSSQTASLKCNQTNDLYTTSDSSVGNKALLKPIGLITADEVTFAGGFGGANNPSYWLYTNQNYWTMSSSNAASDGWAYLFRVTLDGYLGTANAGSTNGVRSVINLRADTQLTGSGTTSDPYVVVGAV